MNTLVVSTDGMGGTILQRLITIVFYLEKKKVTNVWDLLNGGISTNGTSIVKSRPIGKKPNYSQTLKEISNSLINVNNDLNIVCRLSKWHLDERNDRKADQKKFLLLLKNTFEKQVVCLRKNVFEYALSLSIRNESGVSNIKNKKDRNTVNNIKHVDENFFMRMCEGYVEYVNWIDYHFPGIERVFYEDLINDTEQIIRSLTGYDSTIKKNFGTEYRILLRNEYKLHKELISRSKISLTKEEIMPLIKYKTAMEQIVMKGITVHSPIKNTTLTDKKKQIENFDQCLNKFHLFAKNHNWIDQSNATYDFWNKKDLTN